MNEETATPILECANVTKLYKKFAALDDVSFKIEKPILLGLIGKNGAGKTTLLRILSGLYMSTSGSSYIFGEDVRTQKFSRANTILVDDTMTFPFMKLSEILEECAALYPNWDNAKALRLVDYFKLPLNRRHGRLSKGMKSTFNCIIGLCANCAITLMDEPTTGMDAGVRKDFYDIVLNEYNLNPRLIVMSSHMINEMENIISDVLVIKKGKFEAMSEADELTALAWRLCGSKEAVTAAAEGKKIFSKKEALSSCQYDVYGVYSEEELTKIKKSGVEISHLSLNETCIYLCDEGDLRTGLDEIYSSVSELYSGAEGAGV